nr:MAG TPA: hypothetical protein [Caudoviricetes sp.]
MHENKFFCKKCRQNEKFIHIEWAQTNWQFICEFNCVLFFSYKNSFDFKFSTLISKGGKC